MSDIRSEAGRAFVELKTLSNGEILGPSITGFQEFLKGAQWAIEWAAKKAEAQTFYPLLSVADLRCLLNDLFTEEQGK